MHIFGFEISRTKAAPTGLSSVPYDRGTWWWPLVREPFTGAWQRNMELRVETSLAYSAVYACITLIASDVSKIGLKLVEEQEDDIWQEVSVAAFSPVRWLASRPASLSRRARSSTTGWFVSIIRCAVSPR
jgi:hypothetical protein